MSFRVQKSLLNLHHPGLSRPAELQGGDQRLEDVAARGEPLPAQAELEERALCRGHQGGNSIDSGQIFGAIFRAMFWADFRATYQEAIQ